MTKDRWRRLTFALPFMPVVLGLVASAVYLWQRGFGGGHGELDSLIGLLAFPAIFVLPYSGLPIPRFLESSDLLGIIWFPAMLNSLFFWTPLAIFLFRAGRLQRTKSHIP